MLSSFLPHWRYLKYVVRHKWFVFLAGLSLGVPVWNLLVHDLSNFLPSEWFPYAEYFYGPNSKRLPSEGYYHTPGESQAFDVAWNHHQKRNPHHHQYWVLREDSGKVKALMMPDRFIREMVADWAGAGRAQGHNQPGELMEWYQKNKDKMVFYGDDGRHDQSLQGQFCEGTRRDVEHYLKQFI